MRFSIFLLCALLSALAMAADTASVPAAPYQWATPVKQDANLYRIDAKLYHSEQ
ncbi:TPA: hypothetical protein ACU8BU_001611 [Neisseria subflava]